MSATCLEDPCEAEVRDLFVRVCALNKHLDVSKRRVLYRASGATSATVLGYATSRQLEMLDATMADLDLVPMRNDAGDVTYVRTGKVATLIS